MKASWRGSSRPPGRRRLCSGRNEGQTWGVCREVLRGGSGKCRSQASCGGPHPAADLCLRFVVVKCFGVPQKKQVVARPLLARRTLAQSPWVLIPTCAVRLWPITAAHTAQELSSWYWGAEGEDSSGSFPTRPRSLGRGRAAAAVRFHVHMRELGPGWGLLGGLRGHLPAFNSFSLMSVW